MSGDNPDHSDSDSNSSSSSGGGTFEGFGVFAARLGNIRADPDGVIDHLIGVLDDAGYSVIKCHLCEWVDRADDISDVRCGFCKQEFSYCDECSSELYIEDIDDYCCHACAVEKAVLATESRKRVAVVTGRAQQPESGGVVRRLKFTIPARDDNAVNK